MHIYTDASRRENIIGIGYYIIYDNTYFTGNRYIKEEHTSMEAEYFAVMEGLRIALQHSREDTVLHTDCKPLIQKMTVESTGKWNEYKKGYDRLTQKFYSFEIEYVPREKNETAHRQAKEALWEGQES